MCSLLGNETLIRSPQTNTCPTVWCYASRKGSQHHSVYFLNQTIACWNKPPVRPLPNAHVLKNAAWSQEWFQFRTPAHVEKIGRSAHGRLLLGNHGSPLAVDYPMRIIAGLLFGNGSEVKWVHERACAHVRRRMSHPQACVWIEHPAWHIPMQALYWYHTSREMDLREVILNRKWGEWAAGSTGGGEMRQMVAEAARQLVSPGVFVNSGWGWTDGAAIACAFLETGKGKLVGGFCQRHPASLHFKHRFRNHVARERKVILRQQIKRLGRRFASC